MTAEPTIMVPRSLLAEAVHHFSHHTIFLQAHAADVSNCVMRLRCTLAAPPPAEPELSYEEICDILTEPRAKELTAANAQYEAKRTEEESLAYRSLARLLREREASLYVFPTEEDARNFEERHFKPSTVSPSPPETGVKIEAGPKILDGSPFCDAPNCPGRPNSPKWIYSGRTDWRHAGCLSEDYKKNADFLSDLERDAPPPGDLGALLHKLLDDANVARTAGQNYEADELIALLHITAERCPTLAAVDDTVAMLRRMADCLSAEVKAQRARVEPKEMP